MSVDPHAEEISNNNTEPAQAGVQGASGAAILKGGVGYLSALVELPRVWLEISIGLLLGLIALAGVLESLVFAAVLTIVEIVGLLLIVGAGFNAAPVTPFADMVDFGSLLHGGGPMVLAAACLPSSPSSGSRTWSIWRRKPSTLSGQCPVASSARS